MSLLVTFIYWKSVHLTSTWTTLNLHYWKCTHQKLCTFSAFPSLLCHFNCLPEATVIVGHNCSRVLYGSTTSGISFCTSVHVCLHEYMNFNVVLAFTFCLPSFSLPFSMRALQILLDLHCCFIHIMWFEWSHRSTQALARFALIMAAVLSF